MMICPESYYEMQIKGKTAEDIAKKIRGLKNEIGHLKRMIEDPNYGTDIFICPDKHTRLWCARLYLERAIAAYEEAGGKYRPGRGEQRAAAFDAAISTITKLVFSIGCFSSGYEIRTITFEGDLLQMHIELTRIPAPVNFRIPPDYPMPKEEFLAELRRIHIGEWKRHYDSSDYGSFALDETQWTLTIEYADGKKAEYDGSNAYPFSFDAFCDLIGYTENETDDENAE